MASVAVDRILGRQSARSGSECTIRVKSCACTDAETLCQKSILHGPIDKRNDKGVWHTRNCAIVPHLFLYYFDIESNQTHPHGVFDLSCYPDPIVQDNILRFSPNNSHPAAREFQFRFQSASDCKLWVEAIHNQDPEVRRSRFAQFETDLETLLVSNSNALREKESLSKSVDDMNRRMSAWNIELQSLSNQVQQTVTSIKAPETDLDKLFLQVRAGLSDLLADRMADRHQLSVTSSELQIAMRENERLSSRLKMEMEEHNMSKSELVASVTLASNLQQQLLEGNLQLQASTSSLHESQSIARTMQRDCALLANEVKRLSVELKQASTVIKQLEIVNDQFRRAEKEHGSLANDRAMERRLFAAANANADTSGQAKSSGWKSGIKSLFRMDKPADKDDGGLIENIAHGEEIERIMTTFCPEPGQVAPSTTLGVSEDVYNDL